MARKKPLPSPLETSLAGAVEPVYLVDDRQTIAYANHALAAWVDSPIDGVLGRRVEYHSEAPDDSAELLTGLCPDPAALAGERCRGAVSTLDREGRLRRRRAEFIALPPADPSTGASACPVLVVCQDRDLSPNELAADGAEPHTISDELHVALRRRRQAEAGAPAWLIGVSPASERLRRQFQALVASGANALFVGNPGSDPSELARAAFYRASSNSDALLLPLSGPLLDGEEVVSRAASATRQEPPATLLIEEAQALPADTQAALVRVLEASPRTRVFATTPADGPSLIAPLAAIVSTVVLHAPSLADRPEDLPLLTQWLVEQRNAEGGKQVSGVAPEALDQLALYSWPGGVAQLREVITAAHAAASAPTITADDLPRLVQQAGLAARLPSNKPAAIVLDEWLQRVERELIARALRQAGGNKAEAARLLGMTRPRLYRRMATIGMADDSPDTDGTAESP